MLIADKRTTIADKIAITCFICSPLICLFAIPACIWAQNTPGYRLQLFRSENFRKGLTFFLPAAQKTRKDSRGLKQLSRFKKRDREEKSQGFEFMRSFPAPGKIMEVKIF